MEEETKLETPEEKTHRKERERFMRQAITQAKKAEKLMEVPIGCVIVYEGKVYVVCHPGTVPDVRRCDRTGESQRSRHRQHEPEGGLRGIDLKYAGNARV